MKIAIISRGRTLYSTRRIAESARRKKHDVRILDPFRMVLGVEDNRVVTYHDGLRITKYDLVIPRIGVSSTEYGLAILRQFEANDVPVLNPSIAIWKSRDKYHAIQLLAAAGVPVPNTLVTQNGTAVAGIVERLGGAPIVVKFNQGTQGLGVIVCESISSVRSTVQALWSLQQEFTFQEYIGESEGHDVRMIVVGGEVVASMRRSAAPGDFRSNLHRGGSSERFVPDAYYEEVALTAAKTLGLDVAGVDILESKRGPLVLEVNSSPGLHGIETTSRKDIAAMIVALGEARAAR